MLLILDQGEYKSKLEHRCKAPNRIDESVCSSTTIRAFYYVLDRNLDRDRGLDCDYALDRKQDRALDYALAHDCDRDLTLTLAMTMSCAATMPWPLLANKP
ncbi:MAG: hypothetical protein MJA27_06510 [Pseudanabaenales cyanobacterium]|nr:hypothetical protein [Pseudanabaenales cyanobacterium]